MISEQKCSNQQIKLFRKPVKCIVRGNPIEPAGRRSSVSWWKKPTPSGISRLRPRQF